MKNEHDVLQAIKANSGALNEKIGLEWLEANPTRLRARIPVEGNTQPTGILHGGASATLAEALASTGAWLTDTSRVALGMEIKTNHLRPVERGWVTGTAIPLHRGRTSHLWEVRLTDQDGKMTAFATVTIAIRDPH